MTDNNKLNIIFAGTPDFAADILEYLMQNSNAKYNVSAVYTQPDRKAGRGRKLSPSATKLVANKYNLSIEQPINFKDQDNINILKKYNPDLIIVVAYGLILPQAVLDIPKLGCVNIHASILPRWRGAAPIQRAILAGDKQTGVSIQQMEKTLDTGPVISLENCNIENTDTTTSLTNKLCNLAKSLLLNTIDLIYQNKNNIDNLNLTKQDNNFVTYAEKLSKQEGEINWQSSAIEIDRQIRALNPWPSTTTKLSNSNQIVKIINAEVYNNYIDLKSKTPGAVLEVIKSNNIKKLLVQTGNGILAITKLQFSGSKPITITDALNSKYKDYLNIGSLLA